MRAVSTSRTILSDTSVQHFKQYSPETAASRLKYSPPWILAEMEPLTQAGGNLFDARGGLFAGLSGHICLCIHAVGCWRETFIEFIFSDEVSEGRDSAQLASAGIRTLS